MPASGPRSPPPRSDRARSRKPAGQDGAVSAERGGSRGRRRVRQAGEGSLCQLRARGRRRLDQIARDLESLQDKMAPFPQSEAEAVVAAAFGKPVKEVYASFGPAVAAASIRSRAISKACRTRWRRFRRARRKPWSPPRSASR